MAKKKAEYLGLAPCYSLHRKVPFFYKYWLKSEKRELVQGHIIAIDKKNNLLCRNLIFGIIKLNLTGFSAPSNRTGKLFFYVFVGAPNSWLLLLLKTYYIFIQSLVTYSSFYNPLYHNNITIALRLKRCK